jgi:hypothetical protein
MFGAAEIGGIPLGHQNLGAEKLTAQLLVRLPRASEESGFDLSSKSESKEIFAGTLEFTSPCSSGLLSQPLISYDELCDGFLAENISAGRALPQRSRE